MKCFTYSCSLCSCNAFYFTCDWKYIHTKNRFSYLPYEFIHNHIQTQQKNTNNKRAARCMKLPSMRSPREESIHIGFIVRNLTVYCKRLILWLEPVTSKCNNFIVVPRLMKILLVLHININSKWCWHCDDFYAHVYCKII